MSCCSRSNLGGNATVRDCGLGVLPEPVGEIMLEQTFDQMQKALAQVSTRDLYLILLCWGDALLGTTLGSEVATTLTGRTNNEGSPVFTANECAAAFLVLSDLHRRFFGREDWA